MVVSCSKSRFAGITKVDNYYPVSSHSPAQFKFYNEGEKATLYFKLPNMVNNKKTKVQEPTNNLKVEMYRDFNRKSFLDSLSFYMVQPTDEEASGNMIQGQVDLSQLMKFGQPVVLELHINHLVNTTADHIIFVDSVPFSNHDYILLDEEGDIIYDDIIRGDQEVTLVSSKLEGQQLQVETIPLDETLPKPPHAVFSPKPYKLQVDQVYEIPMNQDSVKLSCPDQVFLHLKSLDVPENQLSIFRHSQFYPEVSDIKNMVDALRYITTEDEYDVIRGSESPKQAIDEFWLSCSGSKERARRLIKNYYGRVIFSNRYFTSHRPGWRSDRGLIYIIFGPPKTIYLDKNREFWIYGQQGESDNVTFEFTRVKNPFSETDYRLVRNEAYKSYWYRTVGAWREGRMIYNNQ